MNRIAVFLIAVTVVVVAAFATGFLSLGVNLGLNNNHGTTFLKIVLVGVSISALLGARLLLRNVVFLVHGAYPESGANHPETRAFATKLHRGVEALVALSVVAILVIVLFL